MNFVQPYEIACIQPRARRCPTDPKGRDEAIAKNLTRQLELIDYATAFGRSNVKIAILPEYGINGAWEERTVEQWINTALEIPNPWTDLLAEKAKDRNLYICANILEKDPAWPGRFFNTSFIIDPRGEIILKHWKHNHNAFLLPYTSPCDVYDEFILRYGREALFPVVDTPLGRLGCLTCCECMFPELARCTVFNGAEVILHPTSEFQDQITETTDFLKIARAVDTVSYWASANIGEYANAARGLGASRGRSLVIDYMDRSWPPLLPVPGKRPLEPRWISTCCAIRETARSAAGPFERRCSLMSMPPPGGAGDPTFGWISPSKVWTKLELCANATSGKTTRAECGQSPPVTWTRTW